MERARLLEVIGAFLLGGGVVAVGYELARPTLGGGASPVDADPNEDVGSPTETTESGVAAPTGRSGTGGAQMALATEETQVATSTAAYRLADESGTYQAFPEVFIAVPPPTKDQQAEYSRHGLVTSLGAIVRSRADLESPILGILRAGTGIRVDEERTFGGGCKEGWNRVYPKGWICRAAGLKVGEAPPEDAVVDIPGPKVNQALPYDYWRVNDEMTPFFHRLPSFEEQNRADAAGQSWYAEHKREPMPTHPAQRPPEVPAVVKQYMNAGYYVTKAGEGIKSQRRFLRTTRGVYARKYQLGRKESPSFQGRILSGADDLPLYFVRRGITLKQREGEGSDVLVDSDLVPERLGTHPFVRRIRIGPKDFYEDEQGRLMRSYAVGKAYKFKRPPGVDSDEHWVHIDLSEQVLVAYEGDTPVFATLVSTGKEPGMTPIGVHRIEIKHIATSMRDQPPEDEAYSIDDVPWTQYFAGSIALHGAFWHGGFGLVRSHGCVNLSPADARWLFGFTEPRLPQSWHAYAPRDRGEKGSPVVVTE